MQNLGWYINRLKSMDAGEIAWRLRSLLRDQLDLLRIPAGFVPRQQSTARTPRTAPFANPGFSCSPVSRENFLELQPSYRRCWEDRLVALANDVCENKLTYFDLERFDHGSPLDWQRDHSAGISGPLKLSILTDYRDFATYGDCKLVWEPNRHHQLVVLARAWVVTGDSRYPDKILELMMSWIESNPFGYGMNWKSTLEHGIRVFNWVWALDLIRDYEGIHDQQRQAIHNTLYRLIWDSQRRYSQGSSANNHLIGEAAGVFFGCCYLTDLKEREQWLAESKKILELEIISQTYPSGCTREHAFGYQFFVLQFFHQCFVAGQQCGRPFSDQFADRLRAMYGFMRNIVVDTGDIPNLNDRDDGYVLNLGETQKQPPALVSAGASLFGDDLRMASAETEFWLTGQSSPAPPDDRPSESIAYFDAGYFQLREGRASVFVDAAPLGYGPIAAHGHADCLSLTLALDGNEILVDSGTYDYFSFPELRDYFRSTRAHNTVEVDSRDQSEMLGPFMWGRRAKPVVLSYSDDDMQSSVAAQHDGYSSLDDPVIHRRDVVLDKEDQALDIVDTLDSEGPHDARVYWHFAGDCELEHYEDGRATIRKGNLRLAVVFDGGSLDVVKPGGANPLGWISTAYHVRTPSLCLVQHVAFSGRQRIQTRFTWQ